MKPREKITTLHTYISTIFVSLFVFMNTVHMVRIHYQLLYQIVTLLSITIISTGCETGQYGEDCTQKCGKCQAGTQCDIITGICPEGCQDSWTGSKCNGIFIFYT